eukprot:7574384-Pyramimonas_sp.AAC.1
MREQPLGPSVELPAGPRIAVLGGDSRVREQLLGPSVELPTGHRNRCSGWGFPRARAPTGACVGAP